MSRSDELEQENAALRDRLSRLSEASRRINESLDLDTVLQGVLDSARSLTGARYGVITLLEDARRVGRLPLVRDDAGGGAAHLGHPGRDAYLRVPRRPLGTPPDSGPAGTAAVHGPTRVLPARVGGLRAVLPDGPGAPPGRGRRTHLRGRQGGGRRVHSPGPGNPGPLRVQAALVIANARRYREEQRVRNDLETLIDTSPVGVVVFDAHTGVPLSFNREAMRIVDGLRDPGQSPEQLLGVITVRRADGREVSLDDLPLAQALREAETVQAEKIVMRVPDGRGITALVNATPIRAEGGGVESFVVTLQDLTPLEELERLRAGFLARVSYELRMPLVSIKGSVATALGGLASMERAEIAQFLRIIDRQTGLVHDLIGDLLDVARIETGTLPVHPEPAEVASLVEEAKGEFLSKGGGNSLEVELASGLPWVMADRGRIVRVLGNLVSNAARRTPGGLPIRVTAARDGVHVAVSVSGPGRGAPEDLARHLFGRFSGAGGGGLGSGIGDSSLGLAVCKGIVEAHGGRLQAESDGTGMGLRFTFTPAGRRSGCGRGSC